MTSPTPEGTPDGVLPTPRPLTIAADGSYAARLVATDGAEGWCPERWTLDGPEPYVVRLPGGQPEDPDSQLVPLADGRVLIGRRADGAHHFSLLYPSGPETGELPLGSVESDRVTLLPPAPDGARVYALAAREDATAVWLVCGGAFGPELVTVLAGQCAGGAWLDRPGRLLALDRTDATGRTRTVTVDVEHGGEPTELLRIAEESNDRLLLADPDSGLLLVRSDAPGSDRIGWGVLGSHRPVRFPEALRPEGVLVTPFAVQPGQALLPEACAVALRMTTAEADWVAVWRPQEKELRHLAAPAGWLPGTGRWTADGDLLLPYVTPQVPCGIFRASVFPPEPALPQAGLTPSRAAAGQPGAASGPPGAGPGQPAGPGGLPSPPDGGGATPPGGVPLPSVSPAVFPVSAPAAPAAAPPVSAVAPPASGAPAPSAVASGTPVSSDLPGSSGYSGSGGASADSAGSAGSAGPVAPAAPGGDPAAGAQAPGVPAGPGAAAPAEAAGGPVPGAAPAPAGEPSSAPSATPRGAGPAGSPEASFADPLAAPPAHPEDRVPQDGSPAQGPQPPADAASATGGLPAPEARDAAPAPPAPGLPDPTAPPPGTPLPQTATPQPSLPGTGPAAGAPAGDAAAPAVPPAVSPTSSSAPSPAPSPAPSSMPSPAPEPAVAREHPEPPGAWTGPGDGQERSAGAAGRPPGQPEERTVAKPVPLQQAPLARSA